LHLPKGFAPFRRDFPWGNTFAFRDQRHRVVFVVIHHAATGLHTRLLLDAEAMACYLRDFWHPAVGTPGWRLLSHLETSFQPFLAAGSGLAP
jgi:hypothetical protein